MVEKGPIYTIPKKGTFELIPEGPGVVFLEKIL